MRLPRKTKTFSAVEWAAAVDYMRSLNPAASVGTLTSHTSHGVIRQSLRRLSKGDTLYVPVCPLYEEAAERQFIPLYVAGDVIAESEIPAGSNIYDATP